MNADRQIEIARFLIDREKVRIIQCSSALDAAKENSDGAMFFCPAQFLDRLFHGVERRNHHPLQAIFPFAHASAIQRL